jgi:restriction system protein
MSDIKEPSDFTPEDFELIVKDLIEQSGAGLSRFSVDHLETMEGVDGNYSIDITARFQALGGTFLVLIECKRYKNPIERELVQILNDKLRSIGAQKGMLFSTSTFQRGAVEYASTHGIALVQVVNGESTYNTRAGDGVRHKPPPWANIPKYVGWLLTTEDGKAIRHSSFAECARELLPIIYNTEIMP